MRLIGEKWERCPRRKLTPLVKARLKERERLMRSPEKEVDREAKEQAQELPPGFGSMKLSSAAACFGRAFEKAAKKRKAKSPC